MPAFEYECDSKCALEPIAMVVYHTSQPNADYITPFG